jgi:hypothetical protein
MLAGGGSSSQAVEPVLDNVVRLGGVVVSCSVRTARRRDTFGGGGGGGGVSGFLLCMLFLQFRLLAGDQTRPNSAIADADGEEGDSTELSVRRPAALAPNGA